GSPRQLGETTSLSGARTPCFACVGSEHGASAEASIRGVVPSPLPAARRRAAWWGSSVERVRCYSPLRPLAKMYPEKCQTVKIAVELSKFTFRFNNSVTLVMFWLSG